MYFLNRYAFFIVGNCCHPLTTAGPGERPSVCTLYCILTGVYSHWNLCYVYSDTLMSVCVSLGMGSLNSTNWSCLAVHCMEFVFGGFSLIPNSWKSCKRNTCSPYPCTVFHYSAYHWWSVMRLTFSLSLGGHSGHCAFCLHLHWPLHDCCSTTNPGTGMSPYQELSTLM